MHPSRTEDNHVNFTGHVALTVHILTRFTTKFGEKCSSGSIGRKFTTLVNWSRLCCLAWLGAKRDQRRNKWVTHTSPCICAKGGHFKHLIWIKSTYFLIISFLILGTLSKKLSADVASAGIKGPLQQLKCENRCIVFVRRLACRN